MEMDVEGEETKPVESEQAVELMSTEPVSDSTDTETQRPIAPAAPEPMTRKYRSYTRSPP